MKQQELANLFNEMKSNYEAGYDLRSLVPAMKKLAIAQYGPAANFFAEHLTDNRQEWRAQCLIFLGFHYDSLAPQVIDKIRHVLLYDDDHLLRVKAAEFLSLYARWPDEALSKALESDQDNRVRLAAFKSSLEVAGISRMMIKDEMGTFQVGGRAPGVADVERIIEDELRKQQQR